MLKRRFQQKKIYNRYLKEWKELSTSVYKKILQKEASLCVIKCEGKIIGVTLNYHLNQLVLSHIQSYNIDYSHYNIGDILMLKNLEWCCDHQILVYDLSMGETEFKLKWCNHQYRFNHQIFFAHNSLWQRLHTFITVIKYRAWQYLRKKGIIGGFIQFDKLLYLIRTGRQAE